MPIVFVHGVGTRDDASYESAISGRTALIRTFLLPALGMDPDTVTFLNPYWGGDAAAFAWQHASLPEGDEEAFGPQEETTALLLGQFCAGQAPPPNRAVLEVANRSMVDAVDLLWAASMERARTDEDRQALARLAARAVALAEQEPRPAWLQEVHSDKQFINRLSQELDGAPTYDSEESFGPNPALLRLREGLGRISGATARLSGSLAVRALRPSLNRSASLFIGDILIYLQQRQKSGAGGPIARRVGDQISEAMGIRRPSDPLIVLAHSMGGNIVYDLLADLRPELQCDFLVTVGSQVGVFAELGLFPSVSQPADFTTERVPTLPNLNHWINVFDPNDVLGFTTARIFQGVDDFRYSTGRGVLASHSSYFIRPSFYSRLAGRMSRLASGKVLS